MDQTRKFECDECGKVLNSSSSHIQHSLSHRGVTVFCCETCDEVFLSESQLDQHLEIHNTDNTNKKYDCEVCGKKYSKRSDARAHALLYHYGVKEFECNECGKEFATRKSLVQHSKIHSDVKEYQCMKCGNEFRWKGHLTQHMKRVHFQEKNYFCGKCGKGFFRKSSVNTHEESCRGKDRRTHKCSDCGAAYTSKRHLEEHMKSHKKAQLYVCDECDKVFTYKGHLTLHVNTQHKGMTKHTCQECGRVFSQRGHLNISSTAVNAAAIKLLVTADRLVKELVDAAAVWCSSVRIILLGITSASLLDHHLPSTVATVSPPRWLPVTPQL